MSLHPFWLRIAIFPFIMLAFQPAFAQHDHQKDVVYGYKDGMALVMDVYTPDSAYNKAGIIVIMAGGMTSSPIRSHYAGQLPDVQNLLNEGYVVFAVAHSSQPTYTIEEIRTDIPRAIRYIRFHADSFEIEPDRIGIMGYSSGGHVSIFSAVYYTPEQPDAWDPVDRISSKVQAAVAYYPSTDLLNFGTESTTILEYFRAINPTLGAAFHFRKWDTISNAIVKIEDPELVKELFRANSPIVHVSEDDPPILIIHGSDDKLVPIQQSKIFMEKLAEKGVPHKLLEIPGKGHGWRPPVENEYETVNDWYRKYLLSQQP